MEKLANTLANLNWIVLLILVIFFDGFVGGIIRIGGGKQSVSKIVGWIMLISFILSLISFISLPTLVGWVVRIITLVCLIADIVTVILYHKITLFAD